LTEPQLRRDARHCAHNVPGLGQGHVQVRGKEVGAVAAACDELLVGNTCACERGWGFRLLPPCWRTAQLATRCSARLHPVRAHSCHPGAQSTSPRSVRVQPDGARPSFKASFPRRRIHHSKRVAAARVRAVSPAGTPSPWLVATAAALPLATAAAAVAAGVGAAVAAGVGAAAAPRAGSLAKDSATSSGAAPKGAKTLSGR
jgi:hypothetical protein